MSKTPKRTIVRAHAIARAIQREHSSGKRYNPWAVGMAQAKRAARRRKRGG